MDLITAAQQVAADMGVPLLAIRPESPNPNNWFLGVVLCNRPRDYQPKDAPTYVTWGINWSDPDNPYFFAGHYDLSYDTALKDFLTR